MFGEEDAPPNAAPRAAAAAHPSGSPAEAASAAVRSLRGQCNECSLPVLSNQQRVKVEGRYIHLKCKQAVVSVPQQVIVLSDSSDDDELQHVPQQRVQSAVHSRKRPAARDSLEGRARGQSPPAAVQQVSSRTSEALRIDGELDDQRAHEQRNAEQEAAKEAAKRAVIPPAVAHIPEMGVRDAVDDCDICGDREIRQTIKSGRGAWECAVCGAWRCWAEEPPEPPEAAAKGEGCAEDANYAGNGASGHRAASVTTIGEEPELNAEQRAGAIQCFAILCCHLVL